MRIETKRTLEETSKIPSLFAEMDKLMDDTYEFLDAVRPVQQHDVQDYIDALMRRMEGL